MYSKVAKVDFKGKTREVKVFCNPETPEGRIIEIALEKLENLARLYPNDFEWAYYGMSKGYNVFTI